MFALSLLFLAMLLYLYLFFRLPQGDTRTASGVLLLITSLVLFSMIVDFFRLYRMRKIDKFTREVISKEKDFFIGVAKEVDKFFISPNLVNGVSK